MVIVPDVNLLRYAYFPAFSKHAIARARSVDLLSRQAEVGLPEVVIFGFPRPATSRKGL